MSDETSDRSAGTSDKETDERVERLGGCKNPHVRNAADAAASEPRAFNGAASSGKNTQSAEKIEDRLELQVSLFAARRQRPRLRLKWERLQLD